MDSYVLSDLQAYTMLSGSSNPNGLISVLNDQTGRNWKWKIPDGDLQT